MGSVSSGLHNVPSPHLRQVLGDDGLAKAQDFLDVPYRLLTIFKELQDPQAVWVAAVGLVLGSSAASNAFSRNVEKYMASGR